MLHLSRRAVVALLAALCVSDAAAQTPQPIGTSGIADPPQVLWRDPGAIASRDLFWGIGSQARDPKGPFKFVEEKTGGTQPKVVVTDVNGVGWDVKFGREVHAEIAASRLVHALGYFVEEHYFVPSGRIDGVTQLSRAREHIDVSGRFANARFSRLDPNIVETEDEWTFKENPFVGQKELSGLLILMTMLNNWDIRGEANNAVVRATTPDGSQERRYLVADLGATFGRMGGRISNHSKWNLEDYQAEGFIEKLEDGVVHLDYDGIDSDMDRVPLEHARWFASLVSQLTHNQVRRAFEAAGAAQAEVDGFSARFMEKIRELQVLVRGSGGFQAFEPRSALEGDTTIHRRFNRLTAGAGPPAA